MLNMIPGNPSFSLGVRRRQRLRQRTETAPLFELAGDFGRVRADDALHIERTPAADQVGLKRCLERCTARVGAGPWVGAIPFDVEEPSLLIRPRSLKQLPLGDCDELKSEAKGEPSQLRRLDGELSRREYQMAVAAALSSLQADKLEKVVLAKHSRFELSRAPSLSSLLAALRRANPAATTYALRLDQEEESPRFLVGASPELLVSRHESVVRCMPLAGSRPRCDDPGADLRQREELLASAKDHAEHALMVDSLIEALAPLVQDLSFPRTPIAYCTPAMWHLATPIAGRLRESATTSLDLALALHPTAAVCGVPSNDARTLIRQLESQRRGFYGGAIGMMDENGDGKWFVAIRGAEIEGRSVRVLSGAGLVKHSVPALECQETEDKMNTILRALSASIGKDDGDC